MPSNVTPAGPSRPVEAGAATAMPRAPPTARAAARSALLSTTTTAAGRSDAITEASASKASSMPWACSRSRATTRSLRPSIARCSRRSISSRKRCCTSAKPAKRSASEAAVESNPLRARSPGPSPESPGPSPASPEPDPPSLKADSSRRSQAWTTPPGWSPSSARRRANDRAVIFTRAVASVGTATMARDGRSPAGAVPNSAVPAEARNR